MRAVTPRSKVPNRTTLPGSGTPEAMSNVVLNVPAPPNVMVDRLVNEALAPVYGLAKLAVALALSPVSGPNEPMRPAAGITMPFAPAAVNVTVVRGVFDVLSEPDSFKPAVRFEYVVSV